MTQFCKHQITRPQWVYIINFQELTSQSMQGTVTSKIVLENDGFCFAHQSSAYPCVSVQNGLQKQINRMFTMQLAVMKFFLSLPPFIITSELSLSLDELKLCNMI